ncbi:MAG: hypothetical protein V6Z86_09960, partial [Hyphomicrobiales bacterium]
MPCGLLEVDGDAFYVVAKGSSMIPEGIEDGDYCLISLNTRFVAGLRARHNRFDRDRVCLSCRQFCRSP